MTAASIALALLPLAGGASATAAQHSPVAAQHSPVARSGAAAEVRQAAAPAPRQAKFRAATINVLGSSHTARKGSPYASGRARVSQLVRLLDSRDIHVASLQEFQPDQRKQFARVAKGWAQWPGGTKWNTGTTSVVWRTDRFDFVGGKLVDVPFYDQVRKTPAVLLQHKKKGIRVWFSSFHNPADTARFPDQRRNRAAATKVQANVARSIARSGAPQLLMGDMNERGSYYCRITSMVALTSPAGGTPGRGCRPPKKPSIDWIMSSPRLSWSNYEVSRDALVRRTTDHAVRYGTVTVDSRYFPRSVATR